jgi:hypothetical protein
MLILECSRLLHDDWHAQSSISDSSRSCTLYKRIGEALLMPHSRQSRQQSAAQLLAAALLQQQPV